MKKIFCLILFLCTCFMSSFGTDFMDYDFNQVDNPFAGQKQYTQQDFNEAIQKYQTPKKGQGKGFWNWVYRHTMPQEETSVNYREQYENIPSEMNYPKEVVSLKPSLILGAQIYDSKGQIIPPGYYQITKRDDKILLMQGNYICGSLKAREYKDDGWKKNDIIYARVDSVNDEVIKIIYSNLNDCFVGYARIKD